MKVSDRDGPTPMTDEAGRFRAHPIAAGDSQVDTELRDLLPMIDVLDRFGAHMGADPDRLDARLPEPDATGSLGDFLLGRVIGRGGMGVVYEAVQKSLNRRVALKILPSCSADDPRKVKRFEVEAQAAACLHHPNIVPVYVVGSENGEQFYAMQLIDGHTLADVIAALRCEKEAAKGGAEPSYGKLPPSRIAELGRQAALALHFAHEQGIIHRDIKPSNLLIDGSWRLWVGDFGLARIPGQADLTPSGAVLGTFRYLSPEQASGKRIVVDHRVDVYSLGATLYELITLAPLFEGDDRVELLRKVCHEDPRPPRRIDPTIPKDLETIVLKAIAKDRSERYATALELADELGRFLENRPIHARPPSALDHATKWIRRHRPAAAAAAFGVLVALLGLGAGALWRNRILGEHNKELSRALKLAKEHESATHRLWYDSQIRLAHQAWASEAVELAQEILDGLRPESPTRDLRGFEWHYLSRLCHRDVSLLTDLDTLSMTLSSEGRTLFLGDAYGSLVFWDLAAGRERIRFQAHPREVTGLLLSASGRALASWSRAEGTQSEGKPSEVKLWDPDTARLLASVPGIKGPIADVAFSPDERMLIISQQAATNGGLLWNIARGEHAIAPGAAPVFCDRLAYSPDGRWFATGLPGDEVILRDAATGQAIKTLPKKFSNLVSMIFAPDGQTLIVQSSALTIWDTHSWHELGSFPFVLKKSPAFSRDGNRLAGPIYADESIVLIKDIRTAPRQVPLEGIAGKDQSVVFSTDGKTLAGGGPGLAVTLWDSDSGRKLAAIPRKTASAQSMVFAPGGESLIFRSTDGRVRSWHFVKKPAPIDQLAGHNAEVWGLACTPDGTTLVSSSDDGSIKLWNTRNGELLRTLKGHGSLVAAVAICPDGKLLASAGFDKTVRLWDLPGGQPRAVLRGHTDRVRAVAFSPDRRLVASAGSDKTVRIWDVDRGESLLVFNGHSDTVRALTFDPTGDLVVSSSDDRTIRGIEVKGGGERFALHSAKNSSALAFSPDGSILASGDDGGNLTIWDVATWSRRRSVKGSETEIWGLSFSPDGRTLAAACGDAKVRLWDPLTGQVILVLDGHSRRVNAVAFSADGATLASASHDGAIRLWCVR